MARVERRVGEPIGEVPKIDVNKIPKEVGWCLGQAAFNAALAWKEEQEAREREKHEA